MDILLSGFADEAGITIEEQMNVFEQNDIWFIEMRNVDGKHVLDCTDEELKTLKEKMDSRGFCVSAIGSPIGKSMITDPFAPELEKFKRAVYAAKALGSRYIRAFSFYLPEGADKADYQDEVIKRLEQMVKMAEANGLIYALENESGIFTDTIEPCRFVLERLRSKSIGLAFDPGNFIHNGVQPYPDAYSTLKDFIAYFHIKDAGSGDHFVPCGEGEANMEGLLAQAYRDGFSDFLSIEPHLGYLDTLSRAQQFTRAANALKNTLNKALGTSYKAVDEKDVATK